jgi:hypothetical protein
MPTTALVLARGIQSIIAADEHPVVAKAAADDVAAGSKATLAKDFLAQFPKPPDPGTSPVLTRSYVGSDPGFPR